MYYLYVCAISLDSLADRLIEYILDNVSDNDSTDDAQIRRIKSMKFFLQERQEDVWELCVGMGIAEAYFSISGEKRSGALGGMIERLVRQWLMRPFNQEAIKNLIKKIICFVVFHVYVILKEKVKGITKKGKKHD